MTSPTAIVAYLALFTGAGFSFLFINLLVGKFLRPKAPNVEKLEVYECGEPTIGSSFVQFDIRFYVVALLFIIFDVEVAFFFPWATVYGKATHLMDPNLARVEATLDPQPTSPGLTPAEADLYRELGVAPKAPAFNQDMVGKNVDVATLTPYQKDRIAVQSTARNLAKLSIVDIGAFFAILLVGFAYVWKRGDLDWVRAVDRDAATVGDELVDKPEPVLSG